QLLKIAESHFGQDKYELMKSFHTFEWNLEKHFFVEERAIFTAYNPKYIDEGKESVAGGMGKRQQPGTGIINYIGVSSIDMYIEKAKKLGAKIIMPKTTIPGFGHLVVFLDTENNSLGLWETDSNAQM
ncbi:unnamed protein product, partial [marine sediment metagenome]